MKAAAKVWGRARQKRADIMCAVPWWNGDMVAGNDPLGTGVVIIFFIETVSDPVWVISIASLAFNSLGEKSQVLLSSTHVYHSVLSRCGILLPT